jgi:hypothetical protein
MGASAMVAHGITEPEILEAMACREGGANAVRNIHGEAMCSYGHIIQEIKSQGRSFEKIEFVHEKREANHDAHNLARSPLYESLGRHMWLMSPSMGVCNTYSTVI